MNLTLNHRSVSLLELLISIGIFALLIVGFFSIDTFSRHQVLTSGRRAKLQHDTSYVLEHMAKEIVRAIGNEKVDGVKKVVDITDKTDSEKKRIKVYIDANSNGMREPETSSEDYWIAYRFYDSGGSANQIQYCNQCANKPCNSCTRGWTTLSNKITSFIPTKPTVVPGDDTTPLKDSYVEIQVTSRWIPAQAVSTDNPEITMKNRIYMPVVSTR